MSLKDDLIAAKALIADPAKWAKGLDAYGKNGRYCAGHAVVAASSLGNHVRVFVALERQMKPRQKRETPVASVVLFNDWFWRRHATVLKLFDRAIEAAK